MNIERIIYKKGDNVVSPFGDQPFTCIIWNTDLDDLDTEYVLKLVKPHCKEIIFGGKNFEKFHDELDRAFINSVEGELTDKDVYLTTYYEDDNLQDFLEKCVSVIDKDGLYLLVNMKKGN